MKSDEASLLLLAERGAKDHNDMPSQLRKGGDATTVTHTFKLCKCHIIGKAILATMVPTEVYKKEVDQLNKMFMEGSMDIGFANVLVECPEPWDLTTCPEYSGILKRYVGNVEAEKMKKLTELRMNLNAASFQTLEEELKMDSSKVETYYKELSDKQRSWTDVVCAHKRARYNSGKTKVDLIKAPTPHQLIHPGPGKYHYSIFLIKT